jgi:hypothetical protein
MKFYVELAIAAVLLLLVFDKPTELTELSNTIVGKGVLIVAVGCIAKTRGMGAGLMAALVMLILLHDGREGFQEGAVSKPPPKNKAYKENKKKKVGQKEDFTVSDVRVTEGMRNMESYSNGMAASKFQNGFTGNREPFNGFI